MPESTSVQWPQIKSVLASLDKPKLKATFDLAGTVDLMLTYVESGTDFTNQFGDALGTATSTSLSTTASNPCWTKWLCC